jgi:hypothetical protein
LLFYQCIDKLIEARKNLCAFWLARRLFGHREKAISKRDAAAPRKLTEIMDEKKPGLFEQFAAFLEGFQALLFLFVVLAVVLVVAVVVLAALWIVVAFFALLLFVLFSAFWNWATTNSRRAWICLPILLFSLLIIPITFGTSMFCRVTGLADESGWPPDDEQQIFLAGGMLVIALLVSLTITARVVRRIKEKKSVRIPVEKIMARLERKKPQ